MQLAGNVSRSTRYLAITTPRRSSFINKAFPGDYPWNAQRMPEIDLLIISHDHYDHLDYATIKALMLKVKRVVTLGVGSHLRYWGMDAAIIDEVD